MYYKKIKGNLVYLSPMDLKNEAKIITQWINEDEDIAYFSGFFNSLLGEEKTEKMIEKWNEDPFSFSIVDMKDHEYVGNISLFGFDSQKMVATLGIFIGKPYRGRGIGQEAIKLIIDYAFNSLNMRAIHLEVFAYNEKAYSVYKKLGFVECGRWHESRYHQGKYHDVILMELLREEK